MASLLREPRRTNVFKVAVAYALVGWLIVLASTGWADDPPGTLHAASLRQRLQTAVAAKTVLGRACMANQYYAVACV